MTAILIKQTRRSAPTNSSGGRPPGLPNQGLRDSYLTGMTKNLYREIRENSGHLARPRTLTSSAARHCGCTYFAAFGCLILNDLSICSACLRNAAGGSCAVL